MGHTRRGTLAAGIATLGASAAIFFGATPAQADNCLDGPFETACFTSHGDYFDLYVDDTSLPEYEPYIQWRTSYGRTGSCISNPYGDVHTVCNYDMRENQTVYFKICEQSGRFITCTREVSSPT